MTQLSLFAEAVAAERPAARTARKQVRKRTAREARDAALEQVADGAGDFASKALAAIRGLPADEYTGEAIRVLLTAQGMPPPHHHNAWGAVIAQAVKCGVLAATGSCVSMTGDKSHARKTPVYRKDLLCARARAK